MPFMSSNPLSSRVKNPRCCVNLDPSVLLPEKKEQVRRGSWPFCFMTVVILYPDGCRESVKRPSWSREGGMWLAQRLETGLGFRQTGFEPDLVKY